MSVLGFLSRASKFVPVAKPLVRSLLVPLCTGKGA